MADLKPGLLRQRRNLLMISLALLLYELANGKLTGMSLMAGVKFEKDWVILLFGWIAFFYLWVRYSIRSKDLRQRVRHDWAVSVINDKRYKNLVGKLGGKRLPSGYEDNGTPDIQGNWHSRTLNFAEKLDGSVHRDAHPDAIKTAPYWSALAIECRGWITATFRHAAVTDYVLPHVIAVGTLVVGIASNVESIFRWVAHLWK